MKTQNKKKGLAAIVGVAAASILYTIVPEHEGKVNEGYVDVVGVPTKCFGDTNDVVVGKHYSDAECQESLETQLIAHAKPVLACTPSLEGRTEQLAAAVSLAYNIGVNAYCGSSTAKAFRAGDYKLGCEKMNLWVYAGGKKLNGLVKRRKSESSLCMSSL